VIRNSNFQDLVAKVKNLVALAPVFGEILRPAMRRAPTLKKGLMLMKMITKSQQQQCTYGKCNLG